MKSAHAIALVLALLAASPAARAQGGMSAAQQDEVRAAVREGRHVPLAPVLEQIRRRQPGRQLDTGLEREPDGRPVYRVRWAGEHGRRVDYIVDAQTGAILRTEGR